MQAVARGRQGEGKGWLTDVVLWHLVSVRIFTVMRRDIRNESLSFYLPVQRRVPHLVLNWKWYAKRYVSMFIPWWFLHRKTEQCCTSKKIELARQLSRQMSDGGGTCASSTRSHRTQRHLSTTSHTSTVSHDELEDPEDPDFCTWEQRYSRKPVTLELRD